MEIGYNVRAKKPIRFSYKDVINERDVDIDIIVTNGKFGVHREVLVKRCVVFNNYILRNSERVIKFIEVNTSVQLMEKVLRIIYGENITVQTYEKWNFIALINSLGVDYWVRFLPTEPILDMVVPLTPPEMPSNVNFVLEHRRSVEGGADPLPSPSPRQISSDNPSFTYTGTTDRENDTRPPSVELETDSDSAPILPPPPPPPASGTSESTSSMEGKALPQRPPGSRTSGSTSSIENKPLPPPPSSASTASGSTSSVDDKAQAKAKPKTEPKPQYRPKSTSESTNL